MRSHSYDFTHRHLLESCSIHQQKHENPEYRKLSFRSLAGDQLPCYGNADVDHRLFDITCFTERANLPGNSGMDSRIDFLARHHVATVLGLCKTQIRGLSRSDPRSQFQTTEFRVDCTCLLYTSPSPRDLSTSRMPSSA